MTRLKDRLKSLYDDPREYSPGQISEASVMALTRIKELEAKLAQQDDLMQAAVAAALREAAADVSAVSMDGDYLAERILALITPDAQAALDRMLAAERERCAKVAERMSDEWATEWHLGRKCDTHLEGMSDGAVDVAAAIRKGGE